LAQFVTRLIVGPVVSGTIKARPVELASRIGSIFWYSVRRALQGSRTPWRRVMAAPLTPKHREILRQRSPVKAEVSFDDLAAKFRKLTRGRQHAWRGHFPGLT
jgi:hypothetical protein